jgi:hypothetical protein
MSQSDEDPPRKNKDSKKRKNQEPGKNKNKNRKMNMPFIIEMTSGLESFFDNLEQHSKKSSGKGGGGGGGPAEENDEPCEPFENELDYPASGKFEFLDAKLENVDDLIDLGLEFKEGLYNPYTRYNLNLFKVARLVKPLQELKKMIGMKGIKNDIFDILMYQLQEFDTKKDMLHTVIEGEPGVGKTELTKIIAQIYQQMGYLTNKTVRFVKRSDLIGGYLGQTAMKTQKVLDECKGGILIIDEAYSLGNPDGKDSYSKECIDTLTAYLSECPETIVFVIGYKEALDKCFFSVNKGLERRFGYRFSIDKYEPEHLRLILFKIIKQNSWRVDEKNIPSSFFEDNKDYFIFNGGDMLNLFTKCKFSHSKRYFREKLKTDSKKKINFEDIKSGFKMLLEDSKFAERKNQETGFNDYMMYS